MNSLRIKMGAQKSTKLIAIVHTGEKDGVKDW